MRRLVLAIVAVLAISAGAAATELTILYTNDLHLRFGRLEGLAQRIEAERSRTDAVLLFDAGDAWQDFRTPLAAVWGADEMVEWMNRVGYDVMALGNHDFYWGEERLAALIGAADFSVLCANMHSIDGLAPPFGASTRVRVGGIDVLILGLTTPTYFPYMDYPWLRPTDAARSLIDELARQTEPADLVVCVAHLPVDVARRLAEAVPGVDVFVTGHSHETTPVPVESAASLIVQSGAFGRYLGRLVLEVDAGSATPSVVSNDLLPIEEAPVRIGRGLLRLVSLCLVLSLAAALTLL